MATITREILGTKIAIELTFDEIRTVIRENAMIDVKGDKPVAAEPKKEYTMPKTIRTGCFRDHKDEVMRMLDQGMSRHKIAVYYGVTDVTVRRWVERWIVGTDCTRKGGTAHLTLDDGFDMMRKNACGMTKAQIAAIYGINQNTVTKWISRAKLALNAHPAA